MRGCPGTKQSEWELAVNEFWVRGVLTPSLPVKEEVGEY